MILYIEHPKESTKILDLISKLSRIQGQWTKVGSVVFVYTSNEHLKAKLKKKNFIYDMKIIKYSGINITNEV